MKLLLIFILIFGMAFATEKDFEKDWTHYDRKSITIMPTVWMNSIPDSKRFIIRKVKDRHLRDYDLSNKELKLLDHYFLENIGLPRFNKNVISKKINYNYYLALSQKGKNPDFISTYLKDSVVSPIYEIMKDSSYNRAVVNADESKKINRIARYKDYGITEQELETIMNSGYIFAPFIDQFQFYRNKSADVYISKEDLKKGYKAYGYSLVYGIKLYRMSVENIKGKDVVVLKNINNYVKKYVGNINLKKKSVKNYSYVHSILQKTVYGQVMDFELFVRKMPEFQLTGMYKEAGVVTTQLNLGKKEGLKRDQKYYIVQAYEDEKGTTTKKTGWVLINDAGDNDSSSDVLSSAYVIKGEADIGDKAQEIVPGFNLAKAGINQTYYSFGNYNISINSDNSNDLLNEIKFSKFYGLKWQPYVHNFGNVFNVNQLFWGVGFDFAFGGATGEAYYDKSNINVENYLADGVVNDSSSLGLSMVSDFSFFFEKRYIFKRFMVAIKPFVALHYLDVSAGSFKYDDSTDVNFFYRASSGGFGLELRGEYSWSPFTNIGFGVRFNSYGNSSKLKMYGSKSGMFPTWGRIINILSVNKIGSTSDVDVPKIYDQNVTLKHSGITFFVSISRDYW